MDTLIIFLGGALVGAACMWCSCNRARIAAENERKRMEKRETRLTEERFAVQASADRTREQLMQLQIDQANSAGYIDGYNACRRDMDSTQAADVASGILEQGLKDGKRVYWAVVGR